MMFVFSPQNKNRPALGGASLNRYGNLTVSAQLCRRYGFCAGQLCTVHVERESRRIGLQFYSEDVAPRGSARVTAASKNAATICISIKKTAKEHDLVKGLYTAEWDAEQRMLILSPIDREAGL